MTQEEKDAARDSVTVGQLRRRQLTTLERQIVELGWMIRKGYFERDKAEKFLNEDIGRTLTTLQNIDSMASTEVIFPVEKPAESEAKDEWGNVPNQAAHVGEGS